MKKLSFGIGGAIAGAMLLMTAPKTAHAVVAALVQVVNTAANPAVTQDVTKLASQSVELVTLGSLAVPPHTSLSLYQRFPNGTIAAAPFVVPAGQNFVLTSLDILPRALVPGTLDVALYNGSGAVNPPRLEFFLNNTFNVQYHFPTGLVFPAGDSVGFVNYGISADSANAYVHGYLTSN